MQAFREKVAVISGAAGRIGRALAEGCAREGMQIVLADTEEQVLFNMCRELEASGVCVLPVLADTSKLVDVEALAQKTLDRFGAVHLLFNNAGVAGGAATPDRTMQDWQWLVSINLWGVIHGVHVFTPIMMAQDAECQIVNSVSPAGIHDPAKHGVVSLSETLRYELELQCAKVRVAVLRLGYATAPQHLAGNVFDAIRAGRFYIPTHPEYNNGVVKSRLEEILQERTPAKWRMK